MAGIEESDEKGDFHSTGHTLSSVHLLSLQQQQQMVTIERKDRKEMSSSSQYFLRKERQAC